MADFVFLKVPDKMPPHARRQQRNLGARFLHSAFAEERMPGVNCCLHLFGRVGF